MPLDEKLDALDEQTTLSLCVILACTAFGGRIPTDVEELVTVGVESMVGYFRKEMPTVHLTEKQWQHVRLILSAKIRDSATTLALLSHGVKGCPLCGPVN